MSKLKIPLKMLPVKNCNLKMDWGINKFQYFHNFEHDVKERAFRIDKEGKRLIAYARKILQKSL